MVPLASYLGHQTANSVRFPRIRNALWQRGVQCNLRDEHDAKFEMWLPRKKVHQEGVVVTSSVNPTTSKHT